MPRKPNPPPDDEDQAKRFIDTAKALESDKTGKAFNRAMAILVPSSSNHATNKKRSKL